MKKLIIVLSVSFLLALSFFEVNEAKAEEYQSLGVTYLTIKVEKTIVTASWTEAKNAAGYLLYYAPYPKMFPIESIDMGPKRSLTVELPIGAAYYVAIQPYDKTGSGGYISNIEYFIVGQKDWAGFNQVGECVNIAGAWIESQLYYGDGCGVDDWAIWGPTDIYQDGCNVVIGVDGDSKFIGTIKGNQLHVHREYYDQEEDGILIIEDGVLTISSPTKISGGIKVTVPEGGCSMDSTLNFIR